ncbi:cyclic pyranopterin monophosphate synthase subunit MoaA [Fontibacillus phaseoli]|uniref:GTP 3',8-cyclase n=1 Tax=Fontibacillus phaseoli TaxID=1416533 RepID=A0A369BQF1_9BACL|nr:cyclic pyranopterin monophosphate synthase subunit MoaA [Fontibacillus phaseoli]
MMTSKTRVHDTLQRPLRDLRISVTDRCNFRCIYCMPKEIFGDDYAFLPKNELLSYEEISRLVELFVSLGVKKIRLTGGEPLLRSDLKELVKKIASIDGVEDLALTTNGLLLHRYASELYEAGLRRLNISLDALDPELFGTMNGRGIHPSRILENIDEANRIGYEVKVNMVVQKGMNDREIIPMAEYFKDRKITLRMIEFMDVGTDNAWSYKKVTTKAEMMQTIGQKYELTPVEQSYYGEVAKYYRYDQSTAKLGFITSVSESFCSTCTRARLSSEGKLFTCLFATEGFDLRSMLRAGASNEELLEAIMKVWELRTDRYSDERTEYSAKHRSKIGMSYIGG